MSEIAELKEKTEKLEKRQLDYERQRELDAQEKKKAQTPARSSARVKAAAAAKSSKDANEEEVFLDYLACLAIADVLGFYDKNKDKKTRLLKNIFNCSCGGKIVFSINNNITSHVIEKCHDTECKKK
jgi:hypothetical protein